MRHSLTAHSLFRAMRRLRDPQVQVWVMVGFSVLLVLMGHLHAWNASGEGKNDGRASASRLLLAGARLEWNEDFATSTPRPTHRPVLNLTEAGLPGRKLPAVAITFPDPRPAMEVAAGQPWQALDRPMRAQLAQAGIPPVPLKIDLRWSGESRGNASLVARHCAASGSAPGRGFVIGNGSRSHDGEIEWLSRPASLGAGTLEITLIGFRGQSTPAQWASLAELLVHLEALSGNELVFAQEAPARPLSPPEL